MSTFLQLFPLIVAWVVLVAMIYNARQSHKAEKLARKPYKESGRRLTPEQWVEVNKKIMADTLIRYGITATEADLDMARTLALYLARRTGGL